MSVVKDAKGHGSNGRGYGLSESERNKASYYKNAMDEICRAFTGTASHQIGTANATGGKSLPDVPQHPRYPHPNGGGGK